MTPHKRISKSRKGRVGYTLRTILAFFLVGIALIPVFWMIYISVTIPPEFGKFPTLDQQYPLTFANYIWLSNSAIFVRNFLNSALVATSTTLITIAITPFAAYALSRARFRGARTYLSWLVFSQMFPWVLLAIPLFFVLHSLGLTDSYLGLMITYTSFAVPFVTLLLKGYFDTLPKELDEAGLMDGLSRVGVVFRVVFPISAPAIATAAIFAFVLSWQDFLFALVLIHSDYLRTLPIALQFLQGSKYTPWGLLMGGALVTSAPPILIFLLLQKYIVRGLSLGAVKG